ncbi:Uncharacterised protein [Leclercia adecarboxylata]|uniref:Uncharacterized protein n=1 Tax=Leclercia adecarboxylata TaxID=83655 RepID=A0A4V6JJB4_9ENTR|nr:Uncharacterised protein [Leclercia adecarboxylata]
MFTFRRLGSGVAVGFHHFHFCPFGQTVDAVGYHAIACRQSGGNHHALAVLNTRFNPMFADVVVAVQHPDKVAFVAHLQRSRRDHHGVLFGGDQHPGVDKLVREQGIVLIVEARFQLDGAGGGVDLVIEAQQGAVAQLLLVGPIPGLHG